MIFAILFISCSTIDNNSNKGNIQDKSINELDIELAYTKAQSLLYMNEYEEALYYINYCLDLYPENIAFLSNLDIIYNGLEEIEKANNIRKKILKIWNKEYKDDWILRGSPIAESTWARYLKVTNSHIIIGTEYFMPEKLGDITNYYKIILQDKFDQKIVRIYKLEHSNIIEEYYVLSEINKGSFTQQISFGNKKPDLYQLMENFEIYINNEIDTGYIVQTSNNQSENITNIKKYINLDNSDIKYHYNDEFTTLKNNRSGNTKVYTNEKNIIDGDFVISFEVRVKESQFVFIVEGSEGTRIPLQFKQGKFYIYKDKTQKLKKLEITENEFYTVRYENSDNILKTFINDYETSSRSFHDIKTELSLILNVRNVVDIKNFKVIN